MEGAVGAAHGDVVGNVRQSLILLLGAVGLVLLIGCVNVANLLLARASARGREMAVRQALGAARTRLIRQLLTESVLLSLLGGIVGLAILFCAKGFLLQIMPDSLPRLNEVSINWSVLLFALAASLVAGMIFGLAPALHAGRVDLIPMLKQEARGSTGSGEQARTRRVLMVTEFALSLVLMIAAGLLLRSFWDLLNVRPGFNPQSVMAMHTWLPVPNDPDTDIYGSTAQEAPFVREILRRAATLPGVEEVAVGDIAAIPLGHDRNDLNPFALILEGRENQSDDSPLVNATIVTPSYFHLVGMTLQRGRLLSDSDKENAPPVAVINEAFARTYWPNDDAVGKHLKLNNARGTTPNRSWTTVVGVIADARTESLAEPSVPQIYVSVYQQRSKDLAIFLRGRLDLAATPIELREQVQSGQSRASGFRRADADGHGDRLSLRAAIFVGNGWPVRSHCVASRRARNLRSDFVLGQRAHARDRHSPRTRRAKPQHPAHGFASRVGTCPCRRCGRAGLRADRVALNGRAALRREADRPADVCRCGAPPDRCCFARLLHTGAARDTRRSADRATARVTA